VRGKSITLSEGSTKKNKPGALSQISLFGDRAILNQKYVIRKRDTDLAEALSGKSLFKRGVDKNISRKEGRREGEIRSGL